jgi:hypothetical protein
VTRALALPAAALAALLLIGFGGLVSAPADPTIARLSATTAAPEVPSP